MLTVRARIRSSSAWVSPDARRTNSVGTQRPPMSIVGSICSSRWMTNRKPSPWARPRITSGSALSMMLAWRIMTRTGPGPVLVMIRHASIIDNALPDVILGRAHGLGFRFVIQRELQMLPTIDIGGRWVPTLFVRRASGDTQAELERMRALTVNMSSRDGLLIYPEGTRWTAEKLARAKEIIAERQPEIAPLAARLQNLLPPRLGGTTVLLESARYADVVIFGHV